MRAAAEVGSTANSYQILARLATGGMAEIFLARGEGVAGVERHCVLKRILRERASDVQFVRMFLDEARLAAQLQHPNIAQVYDIGKLGDSYFFTMEYVHGETVRALLHRAQGLRRPLPIACVLTIIAGAAAGLHHAHDRVGPGGRALGIVHRDVSPSNLMVSYEGGVKLVDFGVAKAADRSHETKSGTVKGKISYLSPEQCKGRRVDRRSDLFSLGICFWEMLATERLYRRASDFDNMNAIVSEPPPRPSSRRPDVPRELDEVVLRLLAKSPDDRPQTAEDVIAAVEAVAARTGSVLSGSGLGRFVRELFGQRPEPWLDLEAHRELGEPVTVTSEPIPHELAVAGAGRVEHQLSGVVDLGVPRAETESLSSLGALEASDAGPADAVIDAPITRVARRLSPTTPPPSPPVLPPGLAAAPPPVSVAPAVRSVASPVVSPVRGRRTETAALLPPVEDAFTPSSGAILPAGAAVPPVALVPPVGAAAPPAHAPQPRVTPSVPFAAQGSRSGTVGTRASYAARSPRRTWPLYAVVAGAALVGSVAVAIAMRAGGGSAASASDAIVSAPLSLPAGSRAAAPAPPNSSITVDPIIEPVKEPAAEPGGGSTLDRPGSPGAGAPSSPGVAAGSPDAAPRSVAGETPKSARAEAPTSPAAAVPAATARGDARAGGSPRAPVHTHVTSPAALVPRDDIAEAYASAHYDKVIEQCSAGPVSAEHARPCLLAACQAGDEARARKLVAAVPAAQRDELIAACGKLGVTVKKPGKSAPDCEADPMACQH